MRNKALIVIFAALLLLAAYAAGRYTAPTKIVEKVVTIEKVVEVENKNVRTIIKEVTRPDGTVEKETNITDLTITEKQQDKKLESVKVVEALRPQWRVGAGAGLADFNGRVVYAGSLERRIIGPIFAGVQAVPQLNYYGVSVSLEF